MKTKFILFLALFSLLACNKVPEINEDATVDEQTKEENVETNSTAEYLIPINNQEVKTFSLETGSSGWTAKLDGCNSGLTADLKSSNPYVKLYAFDTNCLVKLTSFVYQGSMFVPLTDFTTWQVGDVATFKNSSNQAHQIKVMVSSQLSSPVKKEDSVSYLFKEFSSKNGVIIDEIEVEVPSISGKGQSIVVVGTQAPKLSIQAVTLTGFNIYGNPVINVVYRCDETVTGSNTETSPTKCIGDNLVGMKTNMVIDSYNSVLTENDASNILLESSTQTMTENNVILPNNALASGGLAVSYTGKNKLVKNPNLILVIGNKDSYVYFNLDFEEIKNND